MDSQLRAYLWPLVALVAVLVGGLVGIYALAPAGDKPNLTPIISSIPTLIVAAAAYLRSRKNGQVIEQTHAAVTSAPQPDGAPTP